MADTAELEDIAARAREKYPEYAVGVVYGYLLRAVWKDAQTPVPVEATSEELLTGGIARQIRTRELAAQRGQRGKRAERARYGDSAR